MSLVNPLKELDLSWREFLVREHISKFLVLLVLQPFHIKPGDKQLINCYYLILSKIMLGVRCACES